MSVLLRQADGFEGFLGFLKELLANDLPVAQRRDLGVRCLHPDSRPSACEAPVRNDYVFSGLNEPLRSYIDLLKVVKKLLPKALDLRFSAIDPAPKPA